MKRIMGLLLILLISINGYCDCFKAKAFTYKDQDKNWQEWKKCNIPFCIENGTITMYYDSSTRHYTVYDANVLPRTDKGELTTYLYYCVDSEGIKCTVKLRFYNDPDDGSWQAQMYIIYNNLIILYDITP